MEFQMKVREDIAITMKAPSTRDLRNYAMSLASCPHFSRAFANLRLKL